MDKRVYRYEFNEILKRIPDISQKEREYLNRIFDKDLIDGLTPFDLKQKIDHLRYNKEDELDQWELEHVRKKLSERMGE